jgi:2-keto-3-deoxy-L-rhamnonate aldolase RhmA
MPIRQPLDAGAGGVFIPLVHSAEEARRAVQAVRYPPQGIRGFAFCRANGYGKDFDEYAAEANENLLTIVMIESKNGVENIDSILAVPGVDGVYIGPYDLSGSYGVPGRIDDERVKKGCRKIIDACEKAGKAAGIHIVEPTDERIEETIASGYTLIGLGMDTVFLAQGAKAALASAHTAMRQAE